MPAVYGQLISRVGRRGITCARERRWPQRLYLPLRFVAASSTFDLAGSERSSPSMSTMLPHKPEDWPRVFEQHLNAGDLDAVVLMYEPEEQFVTRRGELLV